MAKKVTGRTDQGTKKFPGDEEYKKMLAEIDKKDKPSKPSKPKMNVQNVSSAVFGRKSGSDESFKNIHGTISKLTGHVRKAVIRIGSLEKKLLGIENNITNNGEKITRIKNILKTQKSDIGKKLPGSSKDNLEKTLIETNKILVEIQKQLVLDYDTRAKEEKEKKDKLQREQSRKKIKERESLLEKSGKAIKKVVGKVSSKMLAPVKSIFDKVLDFIKTLGAGIAINATLEWLKDEENINKLKGWFSWIKDNWKWMAAAVGAIALLPVIGAISGLLGPVGIIVGLLGKAIPLLFSVLTNPVFLGFAAGAGLLFGMKAAVDTVQKKASGGQAHYDAFNALKEELREEIPGLEIKGSGKNERFGFGNVKGRFAKSFSSTATEEQKALVETYKKRRDALIANRDAMRAEMDKQKDAVVPVMKTVTGNRRGGKSGTREVVDRKATNQLRNEAESKVRAQFEANIQGILEARKMGGPVMAGKPYLVGEGGPEIFAPNINGSVINNMRTEKIYQMISSDVNHGGISMVELPPITNQMTPPEVAVPRDSATEVPEISSVNLADPYRQLSPMLYGITV